MTYIRSIEDLRREVDAYTCNHDMRFYSVDYETLVQNVADDLLVLMKDDGWKWGEEMPSVRDEVWEELVEQYEDKSQQ